MNQDGTYSYSSNKGPKVPLNTEKLRKIILAGAAALVVLAAVLTCFYTIDDKQQGVVTTFGQVTEIVEPGLHFKLPFGIQ